MEKLTDGTIVATLGDDLCALAAALQAGETLAISPGYYRLDRPIVVDKDVTIKSATNDARDVAIVRAGSTALVVTGGAPKIENLTFISPTSREGSAAADDMFPYQSSVAIRGGSPTLSGCRATSAERNGFSVCGEGATARLFRCEARLTYHGGVFFTGGASGVVEECVFADTRLGGVYVEETPDGKWVDVVRTKLRRSDDAAIAVYRGGRVRATECEASLQIALGRVACVTDRSLFLARSCHFYGEAPVPKGMTFEKAVDPKNRHALSIGIAAQDSTVEVVDCVFERLVTSFATIDDPCVLKMTRCKVDDCLESVLIDRKAPAPTFDDCEFFKEPIEFDSSKPIQYYYESDGDDGVRNYRDVVNRNFRNIEKILGPYGEKVVFDDVPFSGFLYPDSRYGGAVLTTNHLCCSLNKAASNGTFRSLELAMVTRMGGLKGRGRSLFSKIARFFRGKSEARLREKYEDMLMVMGVYHAYFAFGGKRKQERFRTMQIPDFIKQSSLANRCFICDALFVPPSDESDGSLTPDPVAIFDYDIDLSPARTDLGLRDDFGLLLIMEILYDEYEFAQKEGGFKLISRLKENKSWPFCELER